MCLCDDEESEVWVPVRVCECVTSSSVAVSIKSTLWQAPFSEGIWSYDGGMMYLHFLNLTVDEGEWSASCLRCFMLRDYIPRYLPDGRLVQPRSCQGHWKVETSVALTRNQTTVPQLCSSYPKLQPELCYMGFTCPWVVALCMMYGSLAL